MAARVGVVGGLNMDLHLFDVRGSGGQAPLLAERYLVEPGGKGANQARGAARLGAEVVLIGRVGDDPFGIQSIEACAADGVDTTFVRPTPGRRTGFVAIELAQGHHRSLVFAPGANLALSWADVVAARDALAACDVVVTQAEASPAVLAGLAELCAAHGVPLLLDPSPPEDVPYDVLTAASAITPDLEEAMALSGRDGRSQVSPVLAARDLRLAGARRVLLKLDERGTLVADDDGVVLVPTLHVEPVDEIGAGDAFLAALAVRRAEGASWLDATRFANVASALSVAGHGLTLPARAEVEAALAQLPAGVTGLPDG